MNKFIIGIGRQFIIKKTTAIITVCILSSLFLTSCSLPIFSEKEALMPVADNTVTETSVLVTDTKNTKNTKNTVNSTENYENIEETEAVESSVAESTPVETSERNVDKGQAGDINFANLRLQSLPIVYTDDTAEMTEFKQALEDFLNEHGLTNTENFSLVFHDLNSGSRYVYNGDNRYQAASCMKAGMAIACARMVEDGYLSWDTAIPAIPDGELYIYEEYELAGYSEYLSLKDLVSRALRYSSNTATSILFNYFKGKGRNLHHFIDEAADMHYAKDTTMSANEGANLLIQLLQHQEIPGFTWILSELGQATWHNYLTRDLPEDICFNKYGEMLGYTHEIGVVKSARPFVYSVFAYGVDAYNLYPELGKFLLAWSER